MAETIHASQIGGNKIMGLLIGQITDYAIFLLTPAGDISSWNSGAERIKGYKADEIIGKHFRVLYPPHDQVLRKPEHELDVASRVGRFEDEGWRIRKDGSLFWANVIITAIRGPEGHLLGFGKVTRDLTERKRSEEQIRELSRRLLGAQDEERGRLTREIHDTLGQYLVAAKMSLDSLVFDRDAAAKQPDRRILDSIGLIDRGITEVRTVSYLLYPPMLEETGLSSAISWYLDGFSERSGIETAFENDGRVGRLPPDVELALFRVVQESLTNVHRHSGSRTARVRLRLQGGDVRLEIEDRGKGFPSDTPATDSAALRTLGVGIRSMRERIQQFGGKFDIRSGEQGTIVEAALPVQLPGRMLDSRDANDNARR
jgi:PAS domain S-box-containing protein